jgi:hypothetical protein
VLECDSLLTPWSRLCIEQVWHGPRRTYSLPPPRLASATHPLPYPFPYFPLPALFSASH